MKKTPLTVGQAVVSRAGRDEGRMFLVLALSGEYALVADGADRKAVLVAVGEGSVVVERLPGNACLVGYRLQTRNILRRVFSRSATACKLVTFCPEFSGGRPPFSLGVIRTRHPRR